MIVSRGLNLVQILSRNVISKNHPRLQQIRNSGHDVWNYRTGPTPPAWARRGATACGVLLWWWFWWNMYHGWEHVVGYYNGELLPDPSVFTDEELGIPADDDDEWD